jgi:hypothetical protein
VASKNPRPTEHIELEYAIEVDGVTVDSLSMRRPTVRDQLSFEDAKGSEGRKVVKMLANLCDVAPSSIEDLDASDFLRVSNVLQSFQSSQSES